MIGRASFRGRLTSTVSRGPNDVRLLKQFT